jgi:hypothetical protein
MRLEADGIERLRNLCDELEQFDVHEVAPMLLHFLERLEGCDLGSPGSIVHTLESMTGYESFLAESLARKPTALSASMVNRIANADRPDKLVWLRLLRGVVSNPVASSEAKAEAAEFLRFQDGT